MRMGRDILRLSGHDGKAWFTGAVLLGIGAGYSLGPVRLPAGVLSEPGLKLLGWFIAGVLCLCLGIMARFFFSDPSLSAAASPGAESVPMDMTPLPPAPPEPAPSEAAPADPFLAALDYLGHSQATVRIGGILALERLVRHGGDLQACTGTLAGYVQQWAGEAAGKSGARPGYDVVAAIAVLSRTLAPGEPMRNLADLRRTNLAGLELPDANLSRFHLEHANLSGSDLRGVNFSGVNFRGADLRGALLSGADFSGASLRGADLTGAILSDDEFGAADLSRAGNISASQLQHIRYHPASPPRLPAGMQLIPPAMARAV